MYIKPPRNWYWYITIITGALYVDWPLPLLTSVGQRALWLPRHTPWTAHSHSFHRPRVFIFHPRCFWASGRAAWSRVRRTTCWSCGRTASASRTCAAWHCSRSWRRMEDSDLMPSPHQRRRNVMPRSPLGFWLLLACLFNDCYLTFFYRKPRWSLEVKYWMWNTKCLALTALCLDYINNARTRQGSRKPKSCQFTWRISSLQRFAVSHQQVLSAQIVLWKPKTEEGIPQEVQAVLEAPVVCTSSPETKTWMSQWRRRGWASPSLKLWVTGSRYKL